MDAQQRPISLLDAALSRPELWSPGVVGQVNTHLVKAVRVLGEFPWHTHAQEDEMFLVLRGTLRIGRTEADGGSVDVRAGEFFIVPHGVRHNTSTPDGEECLMALFEPAATLHAGDVQTARSRSLAEQMGSYGAGAAVVPESADAATTTES